MARRTATPKRRLHESTQRGLCQLVFLTVGFLPLLAAGGWSIAQFLPNYQAWRARSCSQWISQKLGVDVHIAAVESLAPQQYVLHGVKLMHPETLAVLGRIRSVNVLQSNAIWHLQLNAPEMDGRQLGAAWQLVHDWFVCRPQAFAPSVQVAAEEFVIRNSTSTTDSGDSSDQQHLQQLSVGIFPQADETQLIAKFRANTNSEGTLPPATLMISRHHRESQLTTRLSFKTEKTRLPCTLLAPLFPKIVHLGQRAVVAGTFELVQKNSEWKMEISEAWLEQVDIGRLRLTPETRVTGDGALWCSQAEISHRGLESFVGAAYIDRGRIDRGLLVAAQQYLGVQLIRDVQTANISTVMFDRLRCGFSIKPKVLQLTGFAERDPSTGKRLASGTLLADALGEIAVRTEVTVPLENVVAFLSQSSSVLPAMATSSPVVFDDSSESMSFRQALRWLPIH